MLEDCDLSGLRCRWFDPGLVRFRRCRFLDVRVQVVLGAAHFEDCVFSGEWDGTFTARPLDRDPARRVVVAGNDMRALGGMGFAGGVAVGANDLDPERHLVLRVGGPGWDEAVRLAREGGAVGDRLAVLVGSLQGQGPLGLEQDWAVLHRADLPSGVWSRLSGAAGG